MAGTAVQEQHHSEVAQIDTGWVREPADAPSARFGWHGQARKTYMVFGWFFVAFLLLMMIGNHTGHIEDIYLILSAAFVAYYLIRGVVTERRKWRP